MNKTTGDRKYLITSTSKCHFPDYWLGTTYKTSSRYFDSLNLLISNGCSLSKEGEFEDTMKKWMTLDGPKFYIGLPPSKLVKDGTQRFYVNREKTVKDYKVIRRNFCFFSTT